jgi:chromosome segregation ATPase
MVDAHRMGRWEVLVPFYGGVLGFIVLVCLQLLLVRGARLAAKALRAVRQLADDVKALEEQIDDLERRMEQRLEAHTGELDARMNRKLDQKADLIQERLEEHRTALADSLARLGAGLQQVDRFKERLDEVESRIPGLFDKLDEFRDTLARTFQAELGSVLKSFDTSLDSILEEMKSELRLGVSRIETIEGMVRSRHKAEETLLGAPRGVPLPLSGNEQEEFEEWEEQAKELARGGSAEEAAARPQTEGGRPAEAGQGEQGPADDLEADLYRDDEPEGEKGG